VAAESFPSSRRSGGPPAEGDLTRHRDIMSHRFLVKAETMHVAMAIPAEGPSLGIGTFRHVDVNIDVLVEFLGSLTFFPLTSRS